MRAGLAMMIWLATLSCRGQGLPPIQTVFVIVMENNNWSNMVGSTDAPFINSLLKTASYCQQYYNPPGNHPSEPNYLWLEAGTNLAIVDDNPPSVNHQPTTNHLVSLLDKAGISWKAYEEDIGGAFVPLTDTNNYAVRHDPFAFFDDVTGTNNPAYAYGIAHIRPYTELAADLTNHTVARYNFITPNGCHDMHDACAPLYNVVRQADDWLAGEVPKILNSQAYQNGGALFIIWDEGSHSDGPIGLIVLSPLARGGGYYNFVHYTHSSTLRTLQEIFGVTPLLGDAAQATDLSDLFSHYTFSSIVQLTNSMQLTAIGVIPGRTNLVQVSSNLHDWTALATNVSPTNSFTVTDAIDVTAGACFYRLVQLP
jgi:hypothetical protein